MDIVTIQKIGVIEILLDLQEHGPSQKVNFRKRLGLSPNTLVSAHEILWEYGYLQTVNHPRKLLYELSPKGENAVRLLRLLLGDVVVPVDVIQEKGETRFVFSNESDELSKELRVIDAYHDKCQQDLDRHNKLNVDTGVIIREYCWKLRSEGIFTKLPDDYKKRVQEMENMKVFTGLG